MSVDKSAMSFCCRVVEEWQDKKHYRQASPTWQQLQKNTFVGEPWIGQL